MGGKETRHEATAAPVYGEASELHLRGLVSHPAPVCIAFSWAGLPPLDQLFFGKLAGHSDDLSALVSQEPKGTPERACA